MTIAAIQHSAEARRAEPTRSTRDTEGRKPGQFMPKWSTARAALIGYLHGKGWNAGEIARHLGDGTNPASIRAAVRRRYHLPGLEAQASVNVPMKTFHKRGLIEEAVRRGIDPDELASRILHMTIEGDLVGAVLDE